MRASGSDGPTAPPKDFTLELALEYIEDDELVEITPESIRLRKNIWMKMREKDTNVLEVNTLLDKHKLIYYNILY